MYIRRLSESCGIERGVFCLSDNNSITHLEWKCHKGHIWTACYHSIQRGSWCPICRYKNEDKCRKLFEVIFYPHKFLKTRPKSLGGLELDGIQLIRIPSNVNNMEQFITESVTHTY